MTVGGWIILGVFWAAFGCIAWTYARGTYKWSKKVSFIFSLGGPVTGLGAMIDAFEHTSMGGQYTRDWGKNPGEHVVTYRELEGKAPLTRVDKLSKAAVSVVCIFAQAFGAYALYLALSGEAVAPYGIAGALCAAFFGLGLFISVYDLMTIYGGGKRSDIGDEILLAKDGFETVFPIHSVAVMVLSLPAIIYRGVKGY